MQCKRPLHIHIFLILMQHINHSFGFYLQLSQRRTLVHTTHITKKNNTHKNIQLHYNVHHHQRTAMSHIPKADALSAKLLFPSLTLTTCQTELFNFMNCFFYRIINISLLFLLTLSYLSFIFFVITPWIASDTALSSSEELFHLLCYFSSLSLPCMYIIERTGFTNFPLV